MRRLSITGLRFRTNQSSQRRREAETSNLFRANACYPKKKRFWKLTQKSRPRLMSTFWVSPLNVRPMLRPTFDMGLFTLENSVSQAIEANMPSPRRASTYYV
ncbi:Uncharacterized protein HZ326_24274 [Fusarium oxysporum f. sp. albedinis]|nr:Uncharacterized protein HZ326_24274 [Fusarium oxysporum f. sp. albedinis]